MTGEYHHHHHAVELTREEQDFLVENIRQLSADHMGTVVDIIRRATHAQDATNEQDEESILRLNVLDLDPPVQRELLDYVLQVRPSRIHVYVRSCACMHARSPCTYVCICAFVTAIIPVELWNIHVLLHI